MLPADMRLQPHRLVALAVALLATGVIAWVIIRGTGSAAPKAGAAGAGRAQSYCDDFPGASFAPAAARAHVGRFSNPVYGYALTIPPGLSGYTRATGPVRGFTVPLPGKPSALLRVDAAYDALYDITAAGVHRRDIADVQLFDRLLSDSAQPFSLAGVDGGRYRMQVVCRGDPQAYVFEAIIVVRHREIYRLDLKTQAARQSQDEPLLEAMARSWSWLP